MSCYQRKPVENAVNKKTMPQKNEANPILKTKCIKKNQTKVGERTSPPFSHIEPVKETLEIGRNERKYKTPQMNTILREGNEIENVQSLRPPLLRKDVDLTPRSKAAIAPKVKLSY